MQIWCKYNTFYTKKKRNSLPKALILPKNLSPLASRLSTKDANPSSIIHPFPLWPTTASCSLPKDLNHLKNLKSLTPPL